MKIWNGLKNRTGMTGVFVAALGILFMVGAADPASARNATKADIVDPSKCGGKGQNICTTSAAIFISKKKTSKPTSRAFSAPRNGGEWWECPSNRPRRTIHKVDSDKACAEKKLIGAKRTRAKYLGKVHVPKPTGAFTPLLRSAEWWKCPAGFKRNANPIKGAKACDTKAFQVCDSGFVAVGLPFTKTRKCFTKGQCGNIGQRPCTLTERVPACRKNVRLDYFSHTCVDKEMHACISMVRTAKLGQKVGKTVQKVTSESKKLLDNMQKSLFKALPGFEKVNNLSGSDFRDRTSDVNKNLFPTASKRADTFKQIDGFIKLAEPVAPELKQLHDTVKRNKKKLTEFFTSESTCRLSKKERIAKLGSMLGFKPSKKTIKKAGLEPPEWWKGLLIKNAHAARPTRNVYFTLGISVSATKFVGGVVDFYLATDFHSEIGWFMGIGPTIQTSGGKSKKPDIGFTIPFGIALADSIDDIPGWGLIIGGSVKDTNKLGDSFMIGMDASIEFPKKKAKKIELTGLAFTFRFPSKNETSQAEVNIAVTHDWRLGKK